MAKENKNPKKKAAAKAASKPKAVKKKPVSSLKMIQEDDWLEPYTSDLEGRLARFNASKAEIEKVFGSLKNFAQGHQYYGINYDAENKGWWYREWAPAATALHLIGDFNGWNRQSHPLGKRPGGVWEIFLPEAQYKDSFKHESRLKVQVTSRAGVMDRLPAYIKRAVQEKVTNDYLGQYWAPNEAFVWTDQDFEIKNFKEPLIYEAHTGMGSEDLREGTYREFADQVLPRIAKLGYNSIQLMAVMEHPYYGSFGYHISNFFAPSSRFGTPEDLKYLVNKAHNMGIAVIMDIVHSHAVKNMAEGLNNFDGSGGQYFHEGGRGYHDGWDSKLFNYGKWEVKQFLLSNVAYWLDEFHFDGFRFDGVTSMLYFHHGNVSFDHFDKYFREGVEWEAITYLQLAATVAQEVKPGAILIAEDMSGMPGMCRPIEEGGLGFNYRLAMGIPDYWIKLLKHKKDEDWNVNDIWYTLTNRRLGEGNIAYAESHDQAMVGDKTIAFWLMDKEMYTAMDKASQNPIVERGIALHKMIRLISASLGGEGYLNFMGNEFGHPEWIDFPREGNNWSHQHARRQWSLVDNGYLKYEWLNNFDVEMIHLIKDSHLLGAGFANQLWVDEPNQLLAYERGGLIFVFNWHHSNSKDGFTFKVPQPGKYRIVLNSDDANFGGHARIDNAVPHFTNEEGELSVYITSRTAIVLKKE